MKVTNKAKNKMKKIADLMPGETFEFEGKCWIVSDDTEFQVLAHSKRCIKLQDGHAASFHINSDVKPVLAEVIIMNDVD